jgi:hypothetical protein
LLGQVSGGKPLPAHQLRRLVKVLKAVLFDRLWNAQTAPDQPASGSGGSLLVSVSGATAAAVVEREADAFLKAALARLLRDLYDRSSRRPFVAPRSWLVAAAESGRALAEVQGATPRGLRLVGLMPYALPFTERLKLFAQLVATDKQAVSQPSGAPPLRVTVRRSMLLEDGLRELNGRGGDLKRRLHVDFYNHQVWWALPRGHTRRAQHLSFGSFFSSSLHPSPFPPLAGAFHQRLVVRQSFT